MRKKSGFSLVETMVVLLVITIVLGSAAPIINKKMINRSGEDSPWTFQNQNIAYNLNPEDEKIVSIGADKPTTTTTTIKPKLYIKTDNNKFRPHIMFDELPLYALSGNIWFSEQTPFIPGSPTPKCGNSVVLGKEATISSSNAVVLGESLIVDSGINIANIITVSDNEQKISDKITVASNVNLKTENAEINISDSNFTIETDNVSISQYAIGAIKFNNSKTDIGNNIRVGTYKKDPNTDLEKNIVAIGNDVKRRLTNTIENSVVIGNKNRYEASNVIGIGNNLTINYNNNTALLAGKRGNNTIAIGNDFYTYTDTAMRLLSNPIIIGNGFNYTESFEINKIRKGHINNGDGLPYEDIYNPNLYTIDNIIVLGGKNDTVYFPGNLTVDKDVNFNTVDKKARTKVRLSKKDSHDGNALYTLYRNDKSNIGWTTDDQSSYSDRRLKNIGKVFTGGLDEIKKLEVFNYTFKKDKEKTPRVGIMAQDLQKIFPQAVFKGEDGFLRIRMEDIFYSLVNAIKELDNKITELNTEIAELNSILNDLEKKNKTLKKRTTKLEKKLEKKLCHSKSVKNKSAKA
ncbi:tail fiber domain-containing protein [bacterium]|nr:tail fiber domain-containing protein [bacterium]